MTARPGVLGEPVLLTEAQRFGIATGGEFENLVWISEAQEALTARTIILRLEAAGLLIHTLLENEARHSVGRTNEAAKRIREACPACALVAFAKEQHDHAPRA